MTDVHKFYDGLDPNVFPDWLLAIQGYFEWYDMTNTSPKHFARVKLVGFF